MPLTKLDPTMLADNFEQTVLEMEVSVDSMESGEVTTVDGLANVTAPSPASGDVLMYDGAEWINVSGIVFGGGVPVGTMADWPMETPPGGWLECDGAYLLKVEYLQLFDAIGTTYGSSGAAHFQLPDCRGKFKRSWDHGAGIDPGSRMDRGDGTSGDIVGTLQGFAMEQHNHQLQGRANATGGAEGFISSAAGSLIDWLGIARSRVYNVTGATTSTETRPTNINVMTIIAYRGSNPATPEIITTTIDESVWVKDYKASGVPGGTGTVTTWTARDLNTVDNIDNYTWASLNSGAAQITLDAGKYEIDASVPFYKTDYTQTRFRNITDGTTDVLGTSDFFTNSSNVGGRAPLTGAINIGSQKVFELQYYFTATTGSSDLGVNVDTGEGELYTQMKIRRVGMQSAYTEQIPMPTGTIIPYAGADEPSGWFICSGQIVSRATYGDLFSVISTTYGVGDGSTTFGIPDLRGLFVRGAGTNATHTMANGSYFTAALGVYDSDMFQGHYHSATTTAHNVNTGGGLARPSGTYINNGAVTVTGPTTDSAHGTNRHGDETRPANMPLNYIIKH